MYYSLLAIIAQLTTLVALVRAPFHNYNILFWYIPNYIASAFIVVNNIRKADHTTSYTVLAFLTFVGNFVTTILYSNEAWCGPAPAVVTLCTALAFDVHTSSVQRTKA